jgi:tRNA threonylcarbamoyl adenosine modification protein YeaZ
MTQGGDVLVLGFDTSGPFCCAALLRGDRVLSQAYEDRARGQAERLFAMLEEVLQAGGVVWADLDAIGVGTGPGNFTGIRISVAAARGLALSLSRPAIGVSALEALADGAPRPCIATVAARRGELYAQVFGAQEDGLPRLLTPDTLAGAGLPRGLPVLGDAAQTVAAVTQGTAVHGARAPRAVAIARIAARRIGTPQPRPTPLYLRAADAAPARDRAPDVIA